ncbi:MAG: hypothetical protein HQL51_06745 [Magnetococcales bacterium]|nr:hypothetical protein [Magnetococcales bacterium]
MADALGVWLPADESNRLIWRDGEGLEGSGTPVELAHAAKGRRVVAVAPAEEVLSTGIAAMQTSRRNLEKAVPYMLEEQLAAPLEALHVALGQKEKGGLWPVAVVAGSRMAHWMALLTEAGVVPVALVGEAELLPWEAGCWSILLTPEGCLVRTGWHEGFGVEPENLLLYLSAALRREDQARPERVRVWDAIPGGRLAMVAVLDPAWLQEHGLTLTVEETPAEARRLLLPSLQQGEWAVDLLQGNWKTRREWAWKSSPFRGTMLLLTAWLLLAAGGWAVEGLWQGHRADALEERMGQVYLQAFPGSKVVNPRLQMEQKLTAMQSGKGGSGFLPLLTLSGTVLKEVGGVSLKRLAYQNNALDLFLEVGDFQKLDRVKSLMSSRHGLRVEVSSAVKQDHGVVGQLRVQR